MRRYLGLIGILAFPAVLVVYLGLFWNSVKDKPIEASGYPKLLIAAILLLLPFVLWRDIADWLRRNDLVPPPGEFWRAWKTVFFTAGGLTAYVFAMAPLGIYLSSALFTGGLMLALGYRRPVVTGGVIGGTLALLYACAHFLGVDFPGA